MDSILVTSLMVIVC